MRLTIVLIIFCFLSTVAIAAVEEPQFPVPVANIMASCEQKLLASVLPQVKVLGVQDILSRFVEQWGQRESANFSLFLYMTYSGTEISASDRQQAEKLARIFGAEYFDEVVPVHTLEFPKIESAVKIIESFAGAIVRAVANAQSKKSVLIVEFPPSWNVVSLEALRLVVDGAKFLGIENGRHLVLFHIRGSAFRTLPLSLRESLYLANWQMVAVRGTDQYEIGIGNMVGRDLTESDRMIVPLP